MNNRSNVKKLIGVISGKGGVGKSSVTSMLASATMKKGYKVAVMDADLTGPSIPQSFGITEKAFGTEEEIWPVVSKGGIKIMSVNSLLENETDPVVWRGPLLSGVIDQFWNNVIWEDIDVMYVDMPPGTGDVALTVFQSLPLDGIIIVTSPQQLVSMIVQKAVKMAQMMNIPIIGIVENMGTFICPNCGAKHHIFGGSKVKDIALEYGIKEVCELPMDMAVARAMDEGNIEDIDRPELDSMVQACLDAENPGKHDGFVTSANCDHDCSSCGVDGCGDRK
ncbi:MAG: Mrp/NBP35 family ATP-binding protein [Firmicutes bacterium]|nr:Mrp/NBP35 family ATP-binding protein [Bacillota bacterium]MBQ1715886.1 Mrp/NBP35 family ATP-binding protein [Bacillota bacterium]MBQ2160836.1 Mrp/NBP35 family ATP-binding protein [Bacillota bacterium]